MRYKYTAYLIRNSVRYMYQKLSDFSPPPPKKKEVIVFFAQCLCSAGPDFRISCRSP